MLFELGTGKPPPVLKKWGGGAMKRKLTKHSCGKVSLWFPTSLRQFQKLGPIYANLSAKGGENLQLWNALIALIIQCNCFLLCWQINQKDGKSAKLMLSQVNFNIWRVSSYVGPLLCNSHLDKENHVVLMPPPTFKLWVRYFLFVVSFSGQKYLVCNEGDWSFTYILLVQLCQVW